MNKNFKIIFLPMLMVMFTVSTINSFSEPSNNTEIIPIDGEMGIEKTELDLYAPSDNQLPWAFVEGKIKNPVLEYPVIIQIYDDNGEAVHFAQTAVNDDGSYEYRFRVLSVNDGVVNHIFDGNYQVKIFKVVYLNSNPFDQV